MTSWPVCAWGLLETFIRWQLMQGYSLGSVNVRLSTVKTYAKLALRAGTLDKGEYAMIMTVTEVIQYHAKGRTRRLTIGLYGRLAPLYRHIRYITGYPKRY